MTRICTETADCVLAEGHSGNHSKGNQTSKTSDALLLNLNALADMYDHSPSDAPTCPRIIRQGVAEIERLRAALDMINMLACYASEENTDSREQVLLQIGKLARGEVSPEIPTAPKQPVETTGEQP